MFNRYGFIGVVVTGLVIAACAPKQENATAPIPNARMAKEAGKPLDTLGRGYALSQVHCAQCHEFKMPTDMRVDEWHTIVPGMAWNAGLNKSDENAVMDYLVAATKQIGKSKH
jgi:hypothetical protein